MVFQGLQGSSGLHGLSGLHGGQSNLHPLNICLHVCFLPNFAMFLLHQPKCLFHNIYLHKSGPNTNSPFLSVKV